MLKDVLSAATEKRDYVLARRWAVELNGKKIILRDVAEGVIGWITKFKAVGDVISQYDPILLSPPWAVIRFLLAVRCNFLGV